MSFLLVILYFIAMMVWMNIKNIPPHHVLVFSAVLFTLGGFIPLQRWGTTILNSSFLTIFFLVLMSGVIKRQPWLYKVQMKSVSTIHPFFIVMLIMMLSMFINNIPLVMILLPMIHEKVKQSHQKWWIALSYASIFGGMLTLIGTSTNLLVNAWLLEYGYTPFTFFETGLFSFPVVVLAAGLLLRELSVQSSLIKSHLSTNLEDHVIGFKIHQDSNLRGLTFNEAKQAYLNHVNTLMICRREETYFPIRDDFLLQEDDILVFIQDEQVINELSRISGVSPCQTPLQLNNVHLIEAIVIHDFHQNISESKLESSINGRIFAVIHQGRVFIKNFNDVIPQSKDLMLVIKHTKDDIIHPYLSQVSVHTHHEEVSFKNTLATVLFVIAIVLGALGWVPYVISIPILLIISLLNQDVSLKDLALETQPKLILSLYAGLVLAQVFQSPNVKSEMLLLLSGVLTNVPVWIFLAVIVLLTLLFTELMNNGVAAMMMLSLAYNLNEIFNLDFKVIVLMITILASASFMNVLGYQTHLIVLNAGRLKSRDFTLVGWKFTVLFAIGVFFLGLLRIM
jgi:di/tricarboxylate transporter